MGDGHQKAVLALHRDLLEHYPGEATRRLEALDVPEIVEVLHSQPVEATLAVWERLSPDLAERVLGALPEAAALAVLERLDPTRAAALLAALPGERRSHFLGHLTPPAARDLNALLSYPRNSAGALMDPRVAVFRPDATVREALARLRRTPRGRRRLVFVVDDAGRLQGIVEMEDLMLARPRETLLQLARGAVRVVDALASREEVVEKFEQHRLDYLPVVDYEGRLIGVIRHAALAAAARDEASADMLTMVGADRDERALSRISFSVRKRLPWLEINLATAFLAASVVGLFENTISKYTALAVLMPVVAGQAGNTGAQSLAVTIRGLALREIGIGHWPRVLFKEINVAAFNGIAVALTTSLGVLVWSGSSGLALIIGTSMVLSMVIAGLAGAAVPIVLTLFGQDPAQSSSIVLTTITDCTGFFSFLGIATLLSALLPT